MEFGGAAGWATMLPEILGLAFAYIASPRDLISCREVCRHWKYVHDNSVSLMRRHFVVVSKENSIDFSSSSFASIVRNISFKNGRIGTPDFIVNLVEKFRLTLEAVEFDFQVVPLSANEYEEYFRIVIFMYVIRRCQNLIRLRVRSPEIRFMTSTSDKGIELVFPNIKKLELYAPTSEWPPTRGLLHFMMNLPRLEYFSYLDTHNLLYDQHGYNRLIHILSSHIKQHLSLKVVQLDCQVRARDISILIAAAVNSKLAVDFGERRMDLNYIFFLLGLTKTTLDSTNASLIKKANLMLHNPSLPRANDFDMMSGCRNITDLHLSLRRPLGVGNLGFMSHLVKLQTLWLKPVTRTPIHESVGVMRAGEIFGDGIPSLQNLLVDGGVMDVFSLRNGLHVWLPNLRQLQLYNMTLMPLNFILKLVGLEHLAVLKLDNCDFTDAAMTLQNHSETGRPAIAALHCLQELWVTTCRHLTGCFITSGVARSTTLRSLRIVASDQVQNLSFRRACSSVYHHRNFSLYWGLLSIDVCAN